MEMGGSGAWLQRRLIPATDFCDLVGPYPLLLCRTLSALPRDLDALDCTNLASVVFVCDPFLDEEVEAALAGFDVVRPFKTHFLASTEASWEDTATKHHRYYARKALRSADYHVVGDPPSFASEFWRLYQTPTNRFALTGVQALSQGIIEEQLTLPGTVAIAACDGSDTIGACIWYEISGRAYLHLQAQNEAGYLKSVGYGLCAYSIAYFQGRVRWLDFGGVPGATDRAADGLKLFKKGWATATRTTYLCGKILNETLYHALSARVGDDGSYFPAYRGSPASHTESRSLGQID